MNPLVSIIIPTADRRVFLKRALEYAVWQQYSPLEVIVLDASRHPEDVESSIRHVFTCHCSTIVHCEPGTSIGEMRNKSVDMARGKYIVHLDDDDWYSRQYVARMIAELQTNIAITGVSAYYFYDIRRRRGWMRPEYWNCGWPSGSTLCYPKEYWMKFPFERLRTGEDAAFVRRAIALGHPMHCAEDKELTVYMRHGRNTTQEVGITENDAATEDVRRILGPDLDFYDGLSELFENEPPRGPNWHLPPNFRR